MNGGMVDVMDHGSPSAWHEEEENVLRAFSGHGAIKAHGRRREKASRDIKESDDAWREGKPYSGAHVYRPCEQAGAAISLVRLCLAYSRAMPAACL